MDEWYGKRCTINMLNKIIIQKLLVIIKFMNF